ncbi:MAG TPA: FkbM family methyltransferase [Polyangiaceae bacterium]
MTIYASMTANVRTILNAGGLDIHRVRQADRDPFRWFEEFAPRTILDVGANEGQFASSMRQVFPDAKIYSFEPLSQTFARLSERFRSDGRLQAMNFALGSRDEEGTINRCDFSASSSLLQMSRAHKDAYPHTAHHTPEKIQQRRLDSLVADHSVVLEAPVFLKMDVQGFELEVLNGANDTVSKVSSVMTEVSFVELYNGQPLADDVFKALERFGFKFKYMSAISTHPITNRPLFGDAFFVR